MPPPDQPLPPGYICYRCGEKGRAVNHIAVQPFSLFLTGHWIFSCPTNDDPNFDNRPRIKRTTGIPRSMLKVIEKPSNSVIDGSVEDIKQPSGVMVNADGDWVVAEPDKASWEQFQAKAMVSAAAQAEAARGSKELQERGFECPIDNRLFVEPTKTPCCHRTYCNDCVINALLDDDLRCPGCGKEGILIDDLLPDDEVKNKIQSYQEEMSLDTRKLQNKNNPETIGSLPDGSPSTSHALHSAEFPITTIASSPSQGINMTVASRKRAADHELSNERKIPAAMEQVNSTKPSAKNLIEAPKNDRVISPPSRLPRHSIIPHHNMVPGTCAASFPGTPRSADVMPGTTPNINFMSGIWNPMMTSHAAFLNAGASGNRLNNMIYQVPGGFRTGGIPEHGMVVGDGQGQLSGYIAGVRRFTTDENKFNGQITGNFYSQQRTGHGLPMSNHGDSPYFRQPVNPHRHQGRRSAPRPTDYREI